MATITNQNIIDDIIKADGYFDDDPRVVRIVEYFSPLGKQVVWGIVYENEIDKHRYDNPTEFIARPRLLWKANHDQ